MSTNLLRNFSKAIYSCKYGSDKLTSLHLLVILRHIVRSDASKKPNVIIAVKFGHLFSSSFVGTLKHNTDIQYITFLCYGLTVFELQIMTRTVANLHKFPFYDTVHSSTIDCVSYVYDEVSWDALGHNNSYRCRLQ